MIQSHLGEFAALVTAVFWMLTGIAFEYAGKKVGSLSVNLIRLFFAFFLLGGYCYFTRGMFLPQDATRFNIIWLSISGIIGFTLGDLFLFEAYVRIGARVSMLIMSLTPPIAALISWIMMGETMTLMNFAGMILTITGIVMVLLHRESGDEEKPKNKKLKLKFPLVGILLAFGGSVGQATGLVLSKYGMGSYNAFAASQIRVFAGLVGFTFLFFFMKRWNKVFQATKNKKAMIGISIGAIFGPFLGVSFSLLSVKHTGVGIASTIMAIVPVLIIPPAVIFFKEKLSVKEVIGAFVAVGGVALFFM